MKKICVILSLVIILSTLGIGSLIASASSSESAPLIFDNEFEYAQFKSSSESAEHNHPTLRHGTPVYRWIGFREWCPRAAGKQHTLQEEYKECGFDYPQYCGYSAFTGKVKYTCSYGCR